MLQCMNVYILLCILTDVFKNILRTFDAEIPKIFNNNQLQLKN